MPSPFSSAHPANFGDIDSRDYSIAMQSIKGNKLSERVIEDWLDTSLMILVAD
jgi:hypothetical protein